MEAGYRLATSLEGTNPSFELGPQQAESLVTSAQAHERDDPTRRATPCFLDRVRLVAREA